MPALTASSGVRDIAAFSRYAGTRCVADEVGLSIEDGVVVDPVNHYGTDQEDLRAFIYVVARIVLAQQQR
jgi:hypothetical protein